MNTRGEAGERPPTRRSDGFTLVEMLVVIVILGTLSTVSVFGVRGITDRGEASACGADARVLQTAATIYMTQTGVDSIPATGTGDDRYERTLVDAELLDGPSTKYAMDATGSVSTTDAACD